MKKILLILLLLYAIPVFGAEVNEDTTAILTMTFKNEDGVLTAPTTAQYRIDDVSSRTQIRDWTVISPPASSVDVEITYLENAIIKQTHDLEIRRVSVKWTYATGKRGTEDFVYTLVNLNKIP